MPRAAAFGVLHQGAVSNVIMLLITGALATNCRQWLRQRSSPRRRKLPCDKFSRRATHSSEDRLTASLGGESYREVRPPSVAGLRRRATARRPRQARCSAPSIKQRSTLMASGNGSCATVGHIGALKPQPMNWQVPSTMTMTGLGYAQPHEALPQAAANASP